MLPMNAEMGERIPFADKYITPRMIPDWVKKKQSAALGRLTEGSAP